MTEQLETALKAVQLYAAMHPRPIDVTMRQAAEMVGRSEPTIRKMVRNGTFMLNKFGRIPISQIDEAISSRAA